MRICILFTGQYFVLTTRMLEIIYYNRDIPRTEPQCRNPAGRRLVHRRFPLSAEATPIARTLLETSRLSGKNGQDYPAQGPPSNALLLKRYRSTTCSLASGASGRTDATIRKRLLRVQQVCAVTGSASQTLQSYHIINAVRRRESETKETAQRRRSNVEAFLARLGILDAQDFSLNTLANAIFEGRYAPKRRQIWRICHLPLPRSHCKIGSPLQTPQFNLENHKGGKQTSPRIRPSHDNIFRAIRTSCTPISSPATSRSACKLTLCAWAPCSP
ncbi:hypothetical protein B0H14DRAFT_2699898 [Mycena olivaceomarginata]|nr:hypothetical protein B0H14DRAFT_2699898 [Mycena olivaceomarginata]